jgi:Lon protease-like protein
MFPLNTVVFPGLNVPLHVFEERYVALVRDLLDRPEGARVFGSVAIREGYEVGDHGAQSLYRVGCRLLLTDVEDRGDGTYDVLGIGIDRFALEGLDGGGDFPVGRVEERPEVELEVSPDVLEDARAVVAAYRAAVGAFGRDPFDDELPRDAAMLSWTLAASAPLPMPDRQELLETDAVGDRLTRLTELLRLELRAINVIPSLPATGVPRTSWSPN